VPLNWRLTAAEHATILRDCTPCRIFSDAAFEKQARALGVPLADWRDKGEPQATGRDDDDLLIVYTSGTTGMPKGAVLQQRALLWNGYNAIHAHDLRQDDHVLTALPLFHVGGLNNQTLPALLAGARVTLHASFEPGERARQGAEKRVAQTPLGFKSPAVRSRRARPPRISVGRRLAEISTSRGCR